MSSSKGMKGRLVLVLALCCALFVGVGLYATQLPNLTACAQEAEITEADCIEIINAIEAELQEQGTSTLEVLSSQKDAYVNEWNEATEKDKQGIAQAKRESVESSIAKFEELGYFSANNTARAFGSGNPSGITYSSRDFLDLAVASIAAGFKLRKWHLAADLLWYNKTNKQLDINYWPVLGTRIASAPQIAEDLARVNREIANRVVLSSPGDFNGLFASTIEGELYNSLGSFYFQKRYAGNGLVDIKIIDRYDWEFNNKYGIASVLVNILAHAQKIGILTPFYTRIDLPMIPGYAPFDWKYTDSGVAITAVAEGTTTVEWPEKIYDMRVHPIPHVEQPTVNITSIGDKAFSGQEGIAELTLPDAVTHIGERAFEGCSALTELSISENVTSIGDGAFAGCDSLQINVSAQNPNYAAQDNILYNKDRTKIITAGKVADELTVADTVTEIGAYAFAGNGNLDTVVIKGKPTIGTYAFANCTHLTAVYFNSYDVPPMGMYAFVGNEFTLYVPHSQQDAYRSAFKGFTDSIDAKTIRITLHVEGADIQTIDTKFGATIAGIQDPFKTGYTFVGWYATPDFTGTKYVNGGIWDTDEDMTLYAEFAAKQYTITFSGIGSERLPNQRVTYDEPIGNLPEPKREGNTFSGWKDPYGEIYTKDTIWKYDSDQVLTAHWEIHIHTIRFDGNGGAAVETEMHKEYNSVLDSLPRAMRTGYTFVGWNTSADGNGQAISAPYTVTGDITLYAVYTPVRYSVSFDPQEGTGGSLGVDAAFGSPMPEGEEITPPSREGYTFTGYYQYTSKQGTQYYDGAMHSMHVWDIPDTATLFAGWTGNEYEVTLDAQISGATVGSPCTVTYGAHMPTAFMPTRKGYTFKGYYAQTDGNGVCYYDENMGSANSWNVAGNATIYAYWVANDYDVLLDAQGGYDSDRVKPQFDSPMPPKEAPTKQNYIFKGFFTEKNGGGIQYYDENMASVRNWDIAQDCTLYAYWVGVPSTVTLDSCGGWNGTSRVAARYGDPMPAATAPTRTNYIFQGYFAERDGRGTQYYNADMTSKTFWDKAANTTLYAYWRGVSYPIIYDNITFMGQTADVVLDNYFGRYAPTYYEYGTSLEIGRVTAFYQVATPYSPQLIFLGWYTDRSFTQKASSISTTQTGTVHWYAKWRYDKDNPSRIGEVTITDSGVMKQHYDQLWVGFSSGNLYSELKAIGINYLAITFKINMWEVDDGYQDIYIYNEHDTAILWQTTIEHGGNKKYTTPGVHCFQIYIPIDSIKEYNFLKIRYSAHGKNADTWKNDRIYYELSYVVHEQDMDSPEFTWGYQDPYPNDNNP